LVRVCCPDNVLRVQWQSPASGAEASNVDQCFHVPVTIDGIGSTSVRMPNQYDGSVDVFKGAGNIICVALNAAQRLATATVG